MDALNALFLMLCPVRITFHRVSSTSTAINPLTFLNFFFSGMDWKVSKTIWLPIFHQYSSNIFRKKVCEMRASKNNKQAVIGDYEHPAISWVFNNRLDGQ